MKDAFYHEATYIGHSLDSYIIRQGAAFETWVIGTSDSEENATFMEAMNPAEAKKTVEFMVKLRNYKIDPESKNGKYVYVKRIP